MATCSSAPPRPPVADLAEGLVSDWVVKNIYKVVYDPDSLRLDQEATEALRREALAERLAKAKPFKEFAEEWSKQKPGEGALEYYVTYPHPSEGIAKGPLMPSM